MSAAREELAREIFLADNSNAPAGMMEKEWDENPTKFSYAHAIADGLLAAGYVKAETEWAEALVNDGAYEYTVSSDCDGSNVTHWRRIPRLAYQGEASPWAAYTPEPAA